MTATVAHTSPSITATLQQQRQFFATGKTKDIHFRIQQLQALKRSLQERESALLQALYADLRKPELEAFASEFSLILQEIDYALKHLKSWIKPQSVTTPLIHLPAICQTIPEPLGVVLIIAPWNYPLQLLFVPLVGAIAAGNCVILKPSELAPHSAQIAVDLIRNTFDPAWVAIFAGGVEISQQLLAEKFDHIFFTGSTEVGKIVMTAAAQHLTPVTLELGGKSPCIVDQNVQLDYAAKRIIWGKFMNAGQTCIAPDYLLVDRRIKSELLIRFQFYIQEFYGLDPAQSPDYGRIINRQHFDRLLPLLNEGKVLMGGQHNVSDLYIAPTIIDEVNPESMLMQTEIFGPILPIFSYEDLSEAIAFVNQRPKPLALYFFSSDRAKQQQVLQATSSGSVCMNDTLLQAIVTSLPFGGVGQSGMGRSHGKASFDTFSNYRSVLKQSLRLDVPLRYPPYADKINLLRRLLNRFS